MTRPSIVGDWGTSRLRLFKVDRGSVTDRLSGPGIGQLTASPEATLAASLEPWRREAMADGILLCGMAGSRNGLVEIPYAPCPSDVVQWSAATMTTQAQGISVRVAAGLSGANFSDRSDVMRGEETQIFGAMAIEPDLCRGRQILLLPGTHSKWAEILNGSILRFHTFPTGELFALLRDHSTLTRAGTDMSGRDEGFLQGLGRASDGLQASLFEARAAQLLEGRSHGWALGLLSGLLIGAEILEARSLLGPELDAVTIVGDSGLAGLYQQGLDISQIRHRAMDGDACAIGGLMAMIAQGAFDDD